MTQEQTNSIQAAEKQLADAKKSGNQATIDAATLELARVKKEASANG